MASLPLSLHYMSLEGQGQRSRQLSSQLSSQLSCQLPCQLSCQLGCSKNLQSHTRRARHALAVRCETPSSPSPATTLWLSNANANANRGVNASDRLDPTSDHPSIPPTLMATNFREPTSRILSENSSPPVPGGRAHSHPHSSQSSHSAPSVPKHSASAQPLTFSEPASALSRRRVLLSAPLLSLLGLSLSAPAPASAVGRGSGNATVSGLAENVRLEDVESRELQQALEAALGGDLVEAEARFGKLIEESRDSASMWSNRGSVRLSLGKYEDAVADFSQAIDLAPYAAVPYLNRAIAYEALGRYEEAVQDCESAIRNDTHESAAWFNLGNIETKLSNHQRALEAYEIAADLSPGIAGYRLREANSLFQVGFASDAEKLIRSIVRKYPNYAEAHAALAGVLWGEGRLGPAEEQLSEAIEFEPNFRNFSWVAERVEWPPRLLQAYGDFLSLK